MRHFRQPDPPAFTTAAAGMLVFTLLCAAPTVAKPTATTALPRSATESATASPSWTGPDGGALRFSDDEEALRFLRDARIVEIGVELDGSTRPRLVLLELDGVRAHAIFRHVEKRQRRLVLENGEVLNHFRDRYLGEVAAFELDRLLGLRVVPPTVVRVVGDREGSLQLWIEDSFSILQRREASREPPDRDAYNRQIREMSVFDNLINNVDRNQTNAIIDGDWRLWLIDHTRAFLRGSELYDPDRVVWVSETLWQRLRSVSDDRIRSTLEPYLSRTEIRDLLERRRRLVALIDHRILAAGGEAEVVFDGRERTR